MDIKSRIGMVGILLLSIMIPVAISTTASGVDISGSWVGTLHQYQSPIGEESDYPFSFNLSQSGNEILGTSRIGDNIYYAVMEISGSVSNGNFSFSETKYIESHNQPGYNWILKNVVLNYTGESPQTLEGTWEWSDHDLRGTISVKKSATSIPTTALTVDNVWTMDGNDKDKTSFVPGDPLRFGVTVKNDGSSTANGVFALQVTGPKNIVQMGETPKDFASGLTTFGISYDPGIIPKDAPAGTYALTVTVTYNGESSSKQSEFSISVPVSGGPTAPIPPITTLPDLTVNITTPFNNSYSEENVNFSGTANGGTPPYIYTWTSDIDGILGTTTTASLSNEFNKKLTIGTRNISLTVKDSVGNTDIKTATLTVVKQKIKILAVSATPGGTITAEEQMRIDKTINDVRDFYLKSSYGSIYLDFDKYKSTIQLNADLSNTAAIEVEILDKLSVYYLGYNSIVVSAPIPITVNPITYLPGAGQQTLYPVAIVPIESQAQLGMWLHEIGHALGNTVKTSETYDKAMLWGSKACPDLYSCGNVGGWDVMANGNYVFNSKETGLVNQPTDMSVLSKTKLGWLDNKNNVHKEISGEYSIRSTESMQYDESVLIYKTDQFSNIEYYIEAREPIQPSYYRWTLEYDLGPLIGWDTLNNGILIYEINHNSNGKDSINILRNAPFSGGPTFLASEGTSAEYTDLSKFIKFKVSESNANHPYSAKIRIDPCDIMCKLIKGVVLVTNPPLWNPGSFLYSTGVNSTSLDLDLHAYTQDGKHVGMNYTSGEYEMQIPGAVSSGDLVGGEEWIFVPTGTQVRYSVDSHNVKKFLEQNPGINPANATMNYSTVSMEYGENPQSAQLPDGSWTVTNRTISEPKTDNIEPGITKEIPVSNPDIVTYYRGLGQYPNIVETNDLLKAADDWRSDIIPPGFSLSIDTNQLLSLADEWRNS